MRMQLPQCRSFAHIEPIRLGSGMDDVSICNDAGGMRAERRRSIKREPEKLEIPIGTVKNRIHIARKELKDALKIYA